MTTVVTHRQNANHKIESFQAKDILKSKQNNQDITSKPQSKHSISSQKNYKPQMKKSIQKEKIQQTDLLSQKRAVKADSQQPNHLRQIIQIHEQQYKQSKPFSKKYGGQNPNQQKNMQASNSRQQKQQIKPVNSQVKNKTKESFNKKLINNIIKDQEPPSSKHSYRIKKIDNRSPKKIRDDLISINEEEQKIQIEILQLHKSTKKQLQQYKQTYKYNLHNLKKYFPELIGVDEPIAQEFLQQVNQKIKLKKKQLAKLENKIETNPYLDYLKKLPEDIMELESQEEDQVEQLPDNRPRLENNIGSYVSSMKGIKDKKYALNLRRTYDVFKDDDKRSRIQQNQIEPPVHEQQRIKQDGQNKVTINNKLKDFLLS